MAAAAASEPEIQSHCGRSEWLSLAGWLARQIQFAVSISHILIIVMHLLHSAPFKRTTAAPAEAPTAGHGHRRRGGGSERHGETQCVCLHWNANGLFSPFGHQSVSQDKSGKDRLSEIPRRKLEEESEVEQALLRGGSERGGGGCDTCFRAGGRSPDRHAARHRANENGAAASAQISTLIITPRNMTMTVRMVFRHSSRHHGPEQSLLLLLLVLLFGQNASQGA